MNDSVIAIACPIPCDRGWGDVCIIDKMVSALLPPIRWQQANCGLYYHRFGVNKHCILIFFIVICMAVLSIQSINVLLPILEYACQVWSLHTKNCIKQMESIQCHGARWICGAQFNPSNFTWTPSSSRCSSGLHSLTVANFV